MKPLPTFLVNYIPQRTKHKWYNNISHGIWSLLVQLVSHSLLNSLQCNMYMYTT